MHSSELIKFIEIYIDLRLRVAHSCTYKHKKCNYYTNSNSCLFYYFPLFGESKLASILFVFFFFFIFLKGLTEHSLCTTKKKSTCIISVGRHQSNSNFYLK